LGTSSSRWPVGAEPLLGATQGALSVLGCLKLAIEEGPGWRPCSLVGGAFRNEIASVRYLRLLPPLVAEAVREADFGGSPMPSIDAAAHGDGRMSECECSGQRAPQRP
jgi:hypothetical protein